MTAIYYGKPNDTELLLFTLKAEYECKYGELCTVKEKIARYEYSKGGLVFRRGIHSPLLSVKLGLYTNSAGRPVTNRAKAPSFTYGFDKEDKLIYVSRNEEMREEFILYKEDMVLGFTYEWHYELAEPGLERVHELTDLSVCIYENGLLSAVYEACVFNRTDGFALSFNEESYQYEDSSLVRLEQAQWTSFNRQKFFSAFSVEKDSFGLEKQWSENKW